MFRSNDVSPTFERTYPMYAIGGMEDAVVDVVVIQWIMQKLTYDRVRNVIRYITARPMFDERS